MDALVIRKHLQIFYTKNKQCRYKRQGYTIVPKKCRISIPYSTLKLLFDIRIVERNPFCGLDVLDSVRLVQGNGETMDAGVQLWILVFALSSYSLLCLKCSAENATPIVFEPLIFFCIFGFRYMGVVLSISTSLSRLELLYLDRTSLSR